MAIEKTLVVLKPDAVQRRLVGRIINRLERKGLKIIAMRMCRVDEPTARKIYAPHEGKDFHEPLIEFITASPVVAVVLEGNDAISVTRSLLGQTFGPQANPGTIRGDFGASRRYNLVHGSDSPESAGREIAIFFQPRELVEYDMVDDVWVYARVNGEPL